MQILKRVALALCVLSAGQLGAAEKTDVKEKWRTPYELYLDPQEAYAMKLANPDKVLFIDVRAVGEIQFVGFSDAVDANIPIYELDTAAWKEKKDGVHGSYRKRKNQDFVQAVDNLLSARSLTRNDPIILMCTSGGRSPIAARTLHEAGFSKVYTQHQGFEGIKAKDGPHKGKRQVNGWKNAGLPWGYKLKTEKMYFNFQPRSLSENSDRREGASD